MKKNTLLPVLLSVLLILVPSCSKDSKNPTGADGTISTVLETASVNQSEIGAQSIIIKSAFQNDTPVINNSYSANVSNEGTQLLFAVDSTEKLRAMTLSTIENNTPDIMKCDALSTAYSLLFLTPGISTTDPIETHNTIQYLSKLSTFLQLVEYLRINLKTKPLADLLNEDNTQNLLSNCIVEYYEYNSGAVQKRISNTSLWLPGNEVYFSTVYSPEKKKFLTKIENNTFRFVNVYRKDNYLDKYNINTVTEDMIGRIPISWGTMFKGLTTGVLGEPTTFIDDSFDSSSPTSGIMNAEYYTLGWSFKESKIELPDELLNSDMDPALIKSLIYYCAFPVFDLIGGGTTLYLKNIKNTKDAVNIVNQTYNLIRNSSKYVMITNDIAKIKASKSTPEAMQSLLTNGINCLSTIISIIAPAIYKSHPTIYAFIAGSSIGMSSGNLICFGYYLLYVEKATKYVVNNTAFLHQYYSISGSVKYNSTFLPGVSVRLTGAGKDTTATSTTIGTFTFAGLPNGSYTLTPSKTDYTFNPTSITVTVNGANATVQDFAAVKSSIPIPQEIQGITFITVPSGSFNMGSDFEIDPNNPNRNDGSYNNEQPIHKVNISSFQMSATEITQGQYNDIMKNRTLPSHYKNTYNNSNETNYPANMISFEKAAIFCNTLSVQCGLQECYIEPVIRSNGSDLFSKDTFSCNFSANGFRLPTEAEWEYACKAENSTKEYYQENEFKEFGWYYNNCGGYINSVAQKKPNSWGFYDMLGNVSEWCNDFYSNYSSSIQTNPTGPIISNIDGSGDRVLRGGAYSSYTYECRPSIRKKWFQMNWGYSTGFRIVKRQN